MNLRSILSITTTLFACAIGVPAVASNQRPAPMDESAPLAARYPAESILGEWWTAAEEKRPSARVKFVRSQDGTYTGILAWSPEPRRDVNNKDPKLRDRPIVGIVLMWHLTYDDGEYVDGYVYNPEDGSTYRMKAEVLSPTSLKIRGYLGISLFGQSQTWTRAP